MKCINQVKQATAKAEIHSQFLSENPNQEAVSLNDTHDETVLATSDVLTATGENLQSESVNDSSESPSPNDTGMSLPNCVQDAHRTTENLLIDELKSRGERCESLPANDDDDDVNNRTAQLSEYSDVTHDVCNDDRTCDDTNCDNADNAFTVEASSVCNWPVYDDSNGAGLLLKARKTVRISELPPEVSYFRKSGVELTHKRKHTDDKSVRICDLFH